MSVLIVSQILLWIAVAALAALVVALARQVGVLHERIAPVGALRVDRGPVPGEKSPVLEATTLAGERVRIGGEQRSQLGQLLLFVSAACPICKRLIPTAKSFVRAERLSVIFVADGDERESLEMIERFALQGIPFVHSAEIGMRFGVGKLPYAVLVDPRGSIVSSGLVNSREHLESLVVAREIGVGSVQAYLRRGASSPAAAPLEAEVGE